jgi:hypothetical protein
MPNSAQFVGSRSRFPCPPESVIACSVQSAGPGISSPLLLTATAPIWSAHSRAQWTTTLFTVPARLLPPSRGGGAAKWSPARSRGQRTAAAIAPPTKSAQSQSRLAPSGRSTPPPASIASLSLERRETHLEPQITPLEFAPHSRNQIPAIRPVFRSDIQIPFPTDGRYVWC